MTATALPMWTREGTCRPEQCGSACCKVIILDVNPIYQTDPDLAIWLGLHGIDLASHGTRVIARIPLACTALNGEGRCSLYGQPDRPTLCDDFPRGPGDLLGIKDVCTFTFTEA